MKVYEVPLNLSEHDSDMFSKIPQSFVTRLCAYNLLRYQVSVYRTIGPLVQKLLPPVTFGRSRPLIEFMKVCEYSRSRPFLDLGPRSFTYEN